MLTIVPVDFTDINHFTHTDRIELVMGNGGTYYVQLMNGDQRYCPANGSTVQVVFPRALSVQSTPSNQDTTVTCQVVDARDASLLKFQLSASDVSKIVSGGAKLVVTESAVTSTYPVDHIVNRRTNIPGA